MKYNEPFEVIQLDPLPDPIIGVYFLIRDDQVVYVGQSRNVEARIEHHRAGDKVFNAYALMEVSECDLTVTEAGMILAYQPLYNATIPQPSGWLTIGGIIRKTLTEYGVKVARREMRKRISGLSGKPFRGELWYHKSEYLPLVEGLVRARAEVKGWE